MDFKKLFKSLPMQLRYALIGSVMYPLSFIALMLLSLLTAPIKINFIFEAIEGVIVSPSYFLANYFTNRLFIMESYDSFRFHYLSLTLFFTVIIGFLVGLIIGKIKSKNRLSARTN